MYKVKYSAAGIGCFKCVSVDGSMPACEDQFHNNKTNIVSIFPNFIIYLHLWFNSLKQSPDNYIMNRHDLKRNYTENFISEMSYLGICNEINSIKCFVHKISNQINCDRYWTKSNFLFHQNAPEQNYKFRSIVLRGNGSSKLSDYFSDVQLFMSTPSAPQYLTK